MIKDLRGEFPDIALIIDEVSSHDKLEGMLLNHEVGLAVMRNHQHSARLVSEFLRKDEIVLVMDKSHPLVVQASAGSGLKN